MDGRNRNNIRPGLEVAIVLKEDQRTGELTEGIVRNILTNSQFHPHGIKVSLTTGEVGRVKEIWKGWKGGYRKERDVISRRERRRKKGGASGEKSRAHKKLFSPRDGERRSRSETLSPLVSSRAGASAPFLSLAPLSSRS